MGLLSMLREVFGSMNQRKYKEPLKCPSCGVLIKDPGKDRCQACGVRLTSMFKLICPECKTENAFDARQCSKCRHDFDAAPSQKTIYKCPICSYEADFYMLKCPACGTRFV